MLADDAALDADVAADDALVAAAVAEACVLVSSEDKEIHVPVELSADVISPMSLTRPDAT